MKHLIFLILVLLMFQHCSNSGSSAHDPVFIETDFRDIDTANWIVESETETTWDELKGDGYMNIDVSKGITIWYNEKLKRDVIIEFEVEVVNEGGPNDRVSDLNSFWMASDPKNLNNFTERSEWRGGTFWHYYSLNLYYVGLGGHDNTKTRFRKYLGSSNPVPEVIKEYTDPKNLITPNKRCKVKIVCKGEKTQYFYNDRKLFELKEDDPYNEGYFGFRTVNNHMKVHTFKVYEPDK